MMRKGLSMKNPILSRIDEDEDAVPPAADAGSGPRYQRVHSCRKESGRRRLSSGSGKIAGCDSNDVDECAEAFIRRFRRQLQLQRRHSMVSFEKMMSMTEN